MDTRSGAHKSMSSETVLVHNIYCWGVYRKVFSTMNLGVRIAISCDLLLEVLFKNSRNTLHLRRQCCQLFEKCGEQELCVVLSSCGRTVCKTWRGSCCTHTWPRVAAPAAAGRGCTGFSLPWTAPRAPDPGPCGETAAVCCLRHVLALHAVPTSAH